MNQAQWPALREYISAEIALSHARRDLAATTDDEAIEDQAAKVRRLEAQTTRMETAFRESLA